MREEFVKARVSPEEKETFQKLCEEVGCTEAELIRSVLIHRDISLNNLGDVAQVEEKKKRALRKQQADCRRASASHEVGESDIYVSEKRNVPLQVMLTASEKRAIGQRAEALGISVSELVRRSAIYGKIESIDFDIAEIEKLHHELLKEGANLNQLMYFVNAHGLPAYNETVVFDTLERVARNANKVDRFIEELEKRYHIDYVPHDYLADEPDNKKLKNKKMARR